MNKHPLKTWNGKTNPLSICVEIGTIFKSELLSTCVGRKLEEI